MENEKPRRGRPPKVKEEVEVEAVAAKAPAVKAEDVKYVFKSKFINDCHRLKRPIKTVLPDGSVSVEPGTFAQFERNTWITKDPELAKIMRDKIEARRLKDPIHVVETTLMSTSI